jgi:hypothetical protein
MASSVTVCIGSLSTISLTLLDLMKLGVSEFFLKNIRVIAVGYIG